MLAFTLTVHAPRVSTLRLSTLDGSARRASRSKADRGAAVNHRYRPQ
jgi:hypothetical protein